MQSFVCLYFVLCFIDNSAIHFERDTMLWMTMGFFFFDCLVVLLTLKSYIWFFSSFFLLRFPKATTFEWIHLKLEFRHLVSVKWFDDVCDFGGCSGIGTYVIMFTSLLYCDCVCYRNFCWLPLYLILYISANFVFTIIFYMKTNTFFGCHLPLKSQRLHFPIEWSFCCMYTGVCLGVCMCVVYFEIDDWIAMHRFTMDPYRQ